MSQHVICVWQETCVPVFDNGSRQKRGASSDPLRNFGPCGRELKVTSSSFDPDDLLISVRAFATKELQLLPGEGASGPEMSLAFPPRTAFTSDDQLRSSLAELGLTPSATLLIKARFPDERRKELQEVPKSSPSPGLSYFGQRAAFVAGTPPLERAFHSFDLIGKWVFCFAGSSQTSISDLYILDAPNMRWARPLYEGQVNARAHASSVLHDKLIVFGGVRDKITQTSKNGPPDVELKPPGYPPIPGLCEPVANPSRMSLIQPAPAVLGPLPLPALVGFLVLAHFGFCVYVLATVQSDKSMLIGHVEVSNTLQCAFGAFCLIGLPVTIHAGVGTVFRAPGHLYSYIWYQFLTLLSVGGFLLSLAVSQRSCFTREARGEGLATMVCGLPNITSMVFLAIFSLSMSVAMYFVWSLGEIYKGRLATDLFRYQEPLQLKAQLGEEAAAQAAQNAQAAAAAVKGGVSEGDFKFKLVTVGDSGDYYSDCHVSTIGVDFKTVVTMVKGRLVKLQLWDTAGQAVRDFGQERFSVVTGNYYSFIFVYDATSRVAPSLKVRSSSRGIPWQHAMPEWCDSEGNLTADAVNVRDELCRLLRDRGGGSLLRGWRNELDPEFLQSVSRQDVVRAALSFGMQSSEDDLHRFTEQATSTGMLTVMDLDRQTAILATRFKRWAATHGPLRQLCFGADNVVAQLGKVVLQADFVAVCRRTGFDASDEDFTELYGLCDPSESGIRPIDLLFLEPDPQVKEQEEQRLRILRMGQREQKQHLMAEVFQEEKARQVSAKHRLAPRPWQAIDFEHLPKIVCERQHDWQMAAEKRAEEARTEFTLYLRKAYGNEVRAWRRALDPNATYRLTLRGLRKFFHAEVNVRVDQGALWKALDQDGVGHVGIEDVAPRHSHDDYNDHAAGDVEDDDIFDKDEDDDYDEDEGDHNVGDDANTAVMIGFCWTMLRLPRLLAASAFPLGLCLDSVVSLPRPEPRAMSSVASCVGGFVDSACDGMSLSRCGLLHPPGLEDGDIGSTYQRPQEWLLGCRVPAPPGLEDACGVTPVLCGSRGAGCPSGMTCHYCHLPHCSGRIKLDKIRRGTLSQMNDQQRLFIFLPLVRQRASDTGLLPSVAKIVELLEAEMVDPQVTPSVSSPMRKLEKFAARMPLIQLIGCCMHEIPDSVQVALTQVLAHFRQFLRDRLGSCASAWDHPAAVAACLSPQRDGRRLWKSTRKLLLGPFLKATACSEHSLHE
ncbi:rab1D [Symbiodinium microadriaticum]|nr:rab1D [Symbiodinium microadriaticum]